MENDKGTLWPFKACAFLGTTDFVWFILGSVFIFLLQSCSFVTLTDRLLFERVQGPSGVLFHVTDYFHVWSKCLLPVTIHNTNTTKPKIFLKNGHKIQTEKQQSKQFPWNFWLPPFPLLGDWTLFQQHRLLVNDEGVMVDHKYCRRKEQRGT